MSGGNLQVCPFLFDATINFSCKRTKLICIPEFSNSVLSFSAIMTGSNLPSLPEFHWPHVQNGCSGSADGAVLAAWHNVCRG